MQKGIGNAKTSEAEETKIQRRVGQQSSDGMDDKY